MGEAVTTPAAGLAETVRPARLLLVDDNEANRYAVGYWLRQAGFEVVEAETGAEAVRRARDAGVRPDLVVLDIRLPDTTGFEVLRTLRSTPETRDIPVVHLSASFTTGEWRAHGLESGADAYLTHPVEPRELVATVRSLLRLRQAESERERLFELERTARHDAEQAREVAERAAAVKADFLATMSHEFRTPLNAFTGYLQLLEMELVGPLTAQQHDYIARLKASSEHLSALVNDVLDLAKLDAGRMTVAHEPASTGSAIAAALALAKPQAHARGVRLEDRTRGLGDAYLGDEHRVRQILINLLSNAVKFTEPGGSIVIESERESPEWTTVRVNDTGIGIAAERLEAIFEPFVQGESGRTRTRGGTGLGLTISRRFARLMGGDLTVRSTPGAGTTFVLRLPATPATMPPDAHAAGAGGAARHDRATPALGAPAIAAAGARGAEAAPEEQGGSVIPRGAGAVGDPLRDETNAILSRFVAQVGADATFPTAARTLDRRRLVGHLPTLIASIAQTLQAIDDPAGVPSATALRDHDQLLRTIAELHGRQRARLGWQPADVTRELELFATMAAEIAERRGSAEVAALARQLVGQAARTADRALRLALEAEDGGTA